MVVRGPDFQRVKPNGEVELGSASVLPEGIELGDPGADGALDVAFGTLISDLASLGTDEEQPGRREFSGDEAREIGPDRLEKRPLHGSTL